MADITATVVGLEKVIAALNRMDKRTQDHLEVAIKSGALIVQNAAKRNVPVRTGTLKRSIHTQTVEKSASNVSISVGTDVKYGPDVEYGTAPHIIRPRTKKALFWRGAGHPVAWVRHPGSKARPYLRPAIDENRAAVLEKIANTFRRLLRGG